MKNFSTWLQFTSILIGLYILPDHILEGLIVLVLMYDVGFEIPAIDKLVGYNNEFRRWMSKKLDRKAKRKSHGTGL